jgi:hypothetical protein
MTVTLNGPAGPGGSLVHVHGDIDDQNDVPLTSVAIPPGQTATTVSVRFEGLGPIVISTGIQQLGEAVLTVNVVEP